MRVSGGHDRNAQSPSSMTTALPVNPSAASRLPVVISTGSPMSLSGMRCRAVNAWIAVIPGMTS